MSHLVPPRTRPDGLPNNWRYRLSFLVPMRFSSVYGVEREERVAGITATVIETETASWWQWRGRIWRHRVEPLWWARQPAT